MSKFTVLTDYPVAIYSRDHTNPEGTKNDNSRNHRFNEVVYSLFDRQDNRPLSFLDLGCSGGGFVKDCLDDGHVAIGIEGSDYSKQRQRAEWATIPDNLFTADITKPFTVMVYDQPLLFDVVTSWEVMEHILEEDLAALFDNVRRHLTDDGIWVMSVSKQHGFHHVCVHERQWWERKLSEGGFKHRPDLLAKFTLDDWVRGPRQAAPESFHFIVQADKLNCSL